MAIIFKEEDLSARRDHFKESLKSICHHCIHYERRCMSFANLGHTDPAGINLVCDTDEKNFHSVVLRCSGYKKKYFEN